FPASSAASPSTTGRVHRANAMAAQPSNRRTTINADPTVLNPGGMCKSRITTERARWRQRDDAPEPAARRAHATCPLMNARLSHDTHTVGRAGRHSIRLISGPAATGPAVALHQQSSMYFVYMPV